MKVPWEDKLPCAALALLVLAVFYGIYFAKMLAQKRRGIQTRQIGRRKEKDIHTVELLMSAATLGMETFLVNDFLENEKQLDLAAFPHGTLEDVKNWAEALPALG